MNDLLDYIHNIIEYVEVNSVTKLIVWNFENLQFYIILTVLNQFSIHMYVLIKLYLHLFNCIFVWIGYSNLIKRMLPFVYQLSLV